MFLRCACGFNRKMKINKESQYTSFSPQPKIMELSSVSKPDERIILGVSDVKKPNTAGHSGLLCYRKWWERTEVDILVNDTLINGIPIFVEENTLRVINSNNSYFIPLEKISYIRTKDGLRSSFAADDKTI